MDAETRKNLDIYERTVHFVIQILEHDKYLKKEDINTAEKFISYLKKNKLSTTTGYNMKNKVYVKAIEDVYRNIQ